jgi:hypothetical protein
MNPLEDGRVGEHELDPLLHDPNEQVVGGDDESVEDKFPDEEEEPKQVVTSHGADALLVKAPEEPPEATEEASEGDTPAEPQDTPEVKEEPKKTPRKAKKAAPKKKAAKKAAPKKKSTPKKKKKVPIEPADGLTEEVEFDDDDLAEIE